MHPEVLGGDVVLGPLGTMQVQLRRNELVGQALDHADPGLLLPSQLHALFLEPLDALVELFHEGGKLRVGNSIPPPLRDLVHVVVAGTVLDVVVAGAPRHVVEDRQERLGHVGHGVAPLSGRATGLPGTLEKLQEFLGSAHIAERIFHEVVQFGVATSLDNARPGQKRVNGQLHGAAVLRHVRESERGIDFFIVADEVDEGTVVGTQGAVETPVAQSHLEDELRRPEVTEPTGNFDFQRVVLDGQCAVLSLVKAVDVREAHLVAAAVNLVLIEVGHLIAGEITSDGITHRDFHRLDRTEHGFDLWGHQFVPDLIGRQTNNGSHAEHLLHVHVFVFGHV